MKKILLMLLAVATLGFACVEVSAKDVLPRYVSTIYTNTIGLYQVSDKITLYQEPDENSPVVHGFSWTKTQIFPENANFEDLFVVYLPNKDLALMAVTDENEEWVEVIYNNNDGSRGWLKKDDPYKFMTWVGFMNIYGRKYGLRQLQDSPSFTNDMKSATEDKSQTVGTMNQPEKINLNAIRGNFALVSVYDLDRVPKTGYIRWRSNDGVKYFFPDIK